MWLMKIPERTSAEAAKVSEAVYADAESVLHITGANGMVLHVYNVAGVRVMSVKVEGADKRIELNLPKGCYIVKVGKLVRKISIQ